MARLSRENLELQIAEIDLLSAAYPGEEEFTIDSAAVDVVDGLRDWCLDAGPLPRQIPSTVACVLRTRLETAAADRPWIQLNIEFKLMVVGDVDTRQHVPPRVQLRQPDWMTRATISDMYARMPKEYDTVLSIVEYVRDEATAYLISQSRKAGEPAEISEDCQIVRVWFYFPSLSTREKRNDLVNHAPEFGLTGFVLAGKPGVLCLEGQAEKIDAYMKFIKTESWGDIPSHHKKVSERYREDLEDIQRAFADMTEITDLLGDKRGERGNRSDMKVLEAWLIDKGLGSAFSHVLM